MEYGKKLVWNGKFLVWSGYEMEEILQHGIWKNRLPFHSIACPAGVLFQQYRRNIKFYQVSKIFKKIYRLSSVSLPVFYQLV